MHRVVVCHGLGDVARKCRTLGYRYALLSSLQPLSEATWPLRVWKRRGGGGGGAQGLGIRGGGGAQGLGIRGGGIGGGSPVCGPARVHMRFKGDGAQPIHGGDWAENQPKQSERGQSPDAKGQWSAAGVETALGAHNGTEPSWPRRLCGAAAETMDSGAPLTRACAST